MRAVLIFNRWFLQGGNVKNLMPMVFVFLCFFSVPAWAQDDSEFSRIELFGGYSLRSNNYGGSRPVLHYMHGFQVNGTINFHKNIGISADFGMQFASASNNNSVHDHELLFGPRFSLRRNRLTIFAHQLVGGSTFDGGGPIAFALGTGGGLDLHFDDHLGIRIIQFDWIPSKFSKDPGGAWFKDNFRFGFGITVKR
jgi:hypothetical protein